MINDILTFAEAAALWQLDPSTLRKLVNTGKITEGVDFRKSGKVWLITRQAMATVYGPQQK